MTTEIVITYNEPDPGQRDPNPRPFRDGAGRVRVWDSTADRYGWAELNVTWETAPLAGSETTADGGRFLYRTTAVIWTDFDPARVELSHLAREAENGAGYCSEQSTDFVPAAEVEGDGLRDFFQLDTDPETDGE